MAREVSNIGASVRARLTNRARAERSEFQDLLMRYALERLLYRLSVSGFRDRFILKGAMLLTTLGDLPHRLTRDLDLLGYDEAGPERLAETFRAVCLTPVVEDGVNFDVIKLNAVPIRENTEYGGVRISTTAGVGGARIPIQIDIGFGDVVTPRPVEVDYPTLLQDMPAPRILGYPVQTVVAEKFEAVVALGMLNSRMWDFYDLWLISRRFEFESSDLGEAVRRTFERRKTEISADTPPGLSDEFATASGGRWRSFLGGERLAETPGDFGRIIADLRTFLLPLAAGNGDDRIWPKGGPWMPSSVGVGERDLEPVLKDIGARRSIGPTIPQDSSEQLSFAGFDVQPRPADRLFFAVFPDDEAASRMTRLAGRLHTEYGVKGRPLQADRLHVTLHHLGDYVGLPRGVVADASKAAMDLAMAPFDVVFDRVERFQGRPGNRPLVLRGGDGLAALAAFQEALGAAMARAGLGRRVERNFTPHVTLAYGDGDIEGAAIEPIGWTVREFVLVHSLLGRTQHIPLGRWPLSIERSS